MDNVSKNDIRNLCNGYKIDISDANLQKITANVNELLSSVNNINELTHPSLLSEVKQVERKNREWWVPTKNPYNAISTSCNVSVKSEGELADMNIGLKDIIAVAGVPMKCGSAVMRGFVPGKDATVVDRILTAGGTIVAKTNLDEFAGSARGTTGYGPDIRNPHDTSRTAGGSSGGSAVAVSTGDVDIALGTDTGGSVRIPASFCGIVGLKPTYGLIPLTGVVENTYTQDHVGIFSNTVRETARLLDVLVGPDENDQASMSAVGKPTYQCGGYKKAVSELQGIDHLDIGVIEEGIGDGVSKMVIEKFNSICKDLRQLDTNIHKVSIQDFHCGKSIKNTLSFVELATHWRDGAVPYRRGGVAEIYQVGFAQARKAASNQLNSYYASKLLAGAHVIESTDGRHYVQAQAAREALRKQVQKKFSQVDVLLCPTMPDIAPKINDASNWDYDYARNTRLANVTRLPAITLPIDSNEGLPIGVQLIGPAFSEKELLQTASTFEKEILN